MSEANDNDDDYEVGYCRPPVAHQFQKGRSGNPSGVKGTKGKHGSKNKNLKAEVLEELGQRIAVNENGRRRHIPRRTALIKKLIADALNGDAKARDQLFKLASQAEANPETANAEDLIGAAKDAEVLARFRAEVVENHKQTKDEDDDD